MAGLPSRLECEDGQIACSDDSGCFAEADLCDNFQDCADNSDEENCPSITCSDDEFLCEDDDICFPLSYRCDGQEDCFDGSDEQSCKLRQRFVRELLILNTGMLLRCGGVLARACDSVKRSLVRSPLTRSHCGQLRPIHTVVASGAKQCRLET